MNDTTLPIPKNSNSSKKTISRPRRKVGLKKGFALHDWKRLLLASNDLAQRKGQPLRMIKMSEISKHDKVHDSWISLHGKVYNIGPYLHYHPGGVEIFNPCLGGDASVLFDKFHRWVNIENLIGPLLIGYLEPESKDDVKEDVVSKNVNSNIIPTALTKAPNGTSLVSELSMPPPKPVLIGNRQQQKVQILPSLLSSNRKEEDDEDDLNPWEK